MGYALARGYALTRDMLPVTLRCAQASSIFKLHCASSIPLRWGYALARGYALTRDMQSHCDLRKHQASSNCIALRIRASARHMLYIAFCASIKHLEIAFRLRYVQARRVTTSEVCIGVRADARRAASYIAMCASIKHLHTALRLRYLQTVRVTTSEIFDEFHMEIHRNR